MMMPTPSSERSIQPQPRNVMTCTTNKSWRDQTIQKRRPRSFWQFDARIWNSCKDHPAFLMLNYRVESWTVLASESAALREFERKNLDSVSWRSWVEISNKSWAMPRHKYHLTKTCRCRTKIIQLRRIHEETRWREVAQPRWTSGFGHCCLENLATGIWRP